MNAFRSIFVRRGFLVDLPFQWSLVWRSVSVSCFLLVAVLFGLLLPVFRERSASGRDRTFSEDAATVFLYLHANLWWIASLCIVLPALVALHCSHRIAGPLVRFKRTLEQLGNASLPAPLETRRGDYLKPEVALLNAVVARLGERLRRMHDAHRDLSIALACAAEGTKTKENLVEARAAAATLGVELETFLGPDQAAPTDRPEAAPATENRSLAPVG